MTNLSKDTRRTKDLSKEARINTELKRLINFFEEVDENQKAMALPLLQNAAFMKVTLEDLQEIINNEGVTDVYQNGANQHGKKQSATLQSYNSLIKNYANVIKTLSQLVPPAKKEALSPALAPRQKTEAEIEAERKEREEQSDYWAKEAGELLKRYPVG